MSRPRASLPSIGLAAILLLSGCGKSKQAPQKPEKPGSSQLSPAKGTAAASAAPPSAASTEVQQELAAYERRRQPKKAVIGGCAEACESPAKLVGLLFDALAATDRVAALSPLFDWSLLRVDGVDKGSRWAEMWGDYRQREARLDEIDAWLKQWSGWVDRVEAGESLVKARMSGVTIKPIAGRTDVVEVAIRHPRLRDDKSEATWRLECTRRGYEWLVSRIDHRPSARTHDPPPSGSVAPGRL